MAHSPTRGAILDLVMPIAKCGLHRRGSCASPIAGGLRAPWTWLASGAPLANDFESAFETRAILQLPTEAGLLAPRAARQPATIPI